MSERHYMVLQWSGDGDPEDELHTKAGFYVKHQGDGPSDAQVREAFAAEVERGRYPAGRYRLYPSPTVVDVTVIATVEAA